MRQFKEWKPPTFKDNMTKWNWMCQYHENLKLGKYTDIGAFTYINAKFGVTISEHVQIGSHCSLYTHSTIDDKHGPIIIKKNARIGTHSTIMPNITIGENSIIGAYSFVNKDIPDDVIAFGIPIKIHRHIIKQ